MSLLWSHAPRPRGLRADAYRFVRPDVARFLKPGVDPVQAFPALTTDPRRRPETQAQIRTIAREDVDIATSIAAERATLTRMQGELLRIKSALAFNRFMVAFDALKYSPSQPRVPGGHGRESGRWTSGDYGNGARPRVVIDTTNFSGEGVSAEGTDESTDSGFDGADSNPGFDNFGESTDNADPAFDAPGASVDLGQIVDRAPSRDDRGTSDNPVSQRPRVIIDTTVLSDADPDPIRPGEQYAQNIRSLTDANGQPYYSPGGHHEMPEAIFKKWNLQPETRRIFDNATTGTLARATVRTTPDGIPIGNYWTGKDGPHGKYNDAVNELSENFLQRNNLKPEGLTPQNAMDLLAEIRDSQDPRIRDFNRAMRMLRRVFRFRIGRGE